MTVLESLDDCQRSAGEDSLDERAVLIGHGGGRDGGFGEGLRGYSELARVDEARVVVEREEPARDA